MYFTIARDSNGAYRARLYGSNHELLWWTEGYASKAGAQHAINLAKSGAASAPVLDRT